MPPAPHIRPARIHDRLGPDFFDIVAGADFPQTRLIFRNDRWAKRVGLESFTDSEWISHFGRFTALPGSFPEPLALRYHGHQFGVYNPDLGDGRGFLFAQLHDLQDGRLLDLGTKGSGQTPWSRAGDGRLTLKGGMREILATEMLEALGVYTSKSFSLIETGEALMRGDEPSPTRSSILFRLSHSHIRIGTFQRFAFQGHGAAITALMDHTIAHYLPHCARDQLEDRVTAFFTEVCQRVAAMGAQWTAAGFVHGVLNTDNINVLGESFDYGPWRFLPVYDPAFTAAYFDQNGLYAFGRQPNRLLWNLARLAECLSVIAPDLDLLPVLEQVDGWFRAELSRVVHRRLGLSETGDGEADRQWAASLFLFLRESGLPFERVFYEAYGGKPVKGMPDALAKGLLDRAPDPLAKPDHPYFAQGAPCTMLIDEVEAIWAPIAADDDWSLFHDKITKIRAMGDAYGNHP